MEHFWEKPNNVTDDGPMTCLLTALDRQVSTWHSPCFLSSYPSFLLPSPRAAPAAPPPPASQEDGGGRSLLIHQQAWLPDQDLCPQPVPVAHWPLWPAAPAHLADIEIVSEVLCAQPVSRRTVGKLQIVSRMRKTYIQYAIMLGLRLKLTKYFYQLIIVILLPSQLFISFYRKGQAQLKVKDRDLYLPESR